MSGFFRLFLAVILVIGAFFAGYYLTKPSDCRAFCDLQIKTVVPAEFSRLIQSSPHLLLDVRTPQEYATGHLANAVNADFLASPEFIRYLDTLDKNANYLVYCRSGNRSAQARDLMISRGFTRVVDLTGGIVAWSKAGYPLVP